MLLLKINESRMVKHSPFGQMSIQIINAISVSDAGNQQCKSHECKPGKVNGKATLKMYGRDISLPK